MTDENTSWFRRHRRPVIASVCAVLLAGAAVLMFAPGLIAPWSRLNNEEQELDLSSGRARFTRYFLYCQISQNVRDTPLSEVLSSASGGHEEEDWVTVNIFQPGVSNSPHCFFHGAFFQIGQMAKYWEIGNFTPEARAKSARQLLKVWRDGGSYLAARPYFDSLMESIVARSSDQPTTVDDISDDLADRILAAYAKERAPD